MLVLDPGQLEELAALVAERLAGRRPGGLVDVHVVAGYLGVEAEYVYAHAVELGARRLGTGPRARLRFSLDDVDAAISCTSGRESSGQVLPAPERKRRPRRRRSSGTSAPLLPIRGASGGDPGRV